MRIKSFWKQTFFDPQRSTILRKGTKNEDSKKTSCLNKNVSVVFVLVTVRGGCADRYH